VKRQASLPALQRWVLRRIVTLRPYIAEAAVASDARRVSVLTFVSVDLHNTCAAFLRGYFLSSATSAWLGSGQRVTCSQSFGSQRDALTFAVKRVRKASGNGPWRRQEEPRWHDTAIFLRLMNAAGCSNAADVNAAWSVGTTALEDLTKARHYFAHRNDQTASGLRGLSTRYGVVTPSRPESLLVMKGAGRPQSVIEDWVDDLQTVFSLMPA
jgi:hypothetical protein